MRLLSTAANYGKHAISRSSCPQNTSAAASLTRGSTVVVAGSNSNNSGGDAACSDTAYDLSSSGGVGCSSNVWSITTTGRATATNANMVTASGDMNSNSKSLSPPITIPILHNNSTSLTSPSLISITSTSSHTAHSTNATANIHRQQPYNQRYQHRHSYQCRTFSSDGSTTAKSSTTVEKDDGGGTKNNDNNNSSDDNMEQLLAAAFVTAREISALAATERKLIASGSTSCTNRNSTNTNSTTVSASVPTTSQEDRWANVVAVGTEEDAGGTSPRSNSNSNPLEINHSSRNIRHEVKAAEALLKLTSHPSFQRALREHKQQHSSTLRQQQQSQPQHATRIGTTHVDVATSLHAAFVSVISWLCSTLSQLPSPPVTTTYADIIPDANDTGHDRYLSSSLVESELLTRVLLNLHQRSFHLNLPLTLPLYKTMVGLIARHWNNGDSSRKNDTVTLVLLDLSVQVRDILGNKTPTIPNTSSLSSPPPPPVTEEENNIITASFFSKPLQELLHQNKLRSMVELLQGMRSVHDIECVEIQTGMELLSVLRGKVEEDHRLKQQGRRRRKAIANFKRRDEDDVGGGDDNDDVMGGKEEEGGLDEADAVELALMLQRPVMEALHVRKKELEDYQRILNSTVDDMLDTGGDGIVDGISDGEGESGLDGGLSKNLKTRTAIDENDEDDDGGIVTANMIQQPVTGKDEKGYDAKDGSNGDVNINKRDESNYDDDDEEVQFNLTLDKDIEQLAEMVKSMTTTSDDKGRKKPPSPEKQKKVKDAARAVIEKLRKTMPLHNSHEEEEDGLRDEDGGVGNGGAPSASSNPGLVARLHVNPSTGKIENIDFNFNFKGGATGELPPTSSRLSNNDQIKYDELHQEMLRDMIYVRDVHWKIPDIVPQLEEWNGERGVFFSKDFEADLVKDIQDDEAALGGARGFDDDFDDYDDDDIDDF